MTPTSDTEAVAPRDIEPAAPERYARLKDLWERRWVSITITSLVLIFALAFLSDRMFISVYPGQGMVLYHRFDNDAIPNEVYYEGFYIVAPWNIAYKYDLTYQQLTVPIVALSKNGLEVSIETSITFRPIGALLPHLHRRYGMHYPEKLVIPQLRTALQDIVGQFLPEEIYSLSRSAQHEEIFEKAERIIGGVYIDIGDVSIINVKLPAKVQQAIQEKLEAQQVAEMYDFRIEAEKKEAARKLEEAKGIQEFQETISKGISPQVLEWKGIEATLELAKSPNAKVIVIGSSKSGLPLILGSDQDAVKTK
jgi:regulator of protease activity HflC (stomatin/prohibitin superfamily)